MNRETLISDGFLASPPQGGLSDVEVLLQDVALSMAFQVTPSNPQYVIKRLLPNDCYKIISGMPSFSERHGIGEVGHLHTPVPKKALLHAIEWNEIVTIDDAAHDDSVGCYMSGHIKSKNIQSVAIVPIGRNDVRWLIVLDKVPPSGKGFSPRDREHLETCKSSTERSLLHLSEEIAEVNNRTLQKALSEYAHLFRNPLTVIGGFARKLKQTRDPERIEAYSEIICAQSQRLEEDFCSFMALVGFLFPGRHRRVRGRLERHLRFFLADPQYQFLGDRQLLECEVQVVPEARAGPLRGISKIPPVQLGDRGEHPHRGQEGADARGRDLLQHGFPGVQGGQGRAAGDLPPGRLPARRGFPHGERLVPDHPAAAARKRPIAGGPCSLLARCGCFRLLSACTGRGLTPEPAYSSSCLRTIRSASNSATRSRPAAPIRRASAGASSRSAIRAASAGVVAGRDKMAGDALRHRLRRAVHPIGYDRAARRHRLREHPRQPLPERREDEHVQAGDDRVHITPPPEQAEAPPETGAPDLLLDRRAQDPVPGEEKLRFRHAPGDERGRPDEIHRVFLRFEAGDHADQRPRRVETEGADRRLPVDPRPRVARDLDPAADEAGALAGEEAERNALVEVGLRHRDDVGRPPGRQPLERDVKPAHARPLARVKAKAVHGVDHHRHPREPRRRASEDARLAAVRVDDHRGGAGPDAATRLAHLPPQDARRARRARCRRGRDAPRAPANGRNACRTGCPPGRRRRATPPDG